MVTKANKKTDVAVESYAFKYDRFITLNLTASNDAIDSLADDTGMSAKGVSYVFQYGLKQVFDDEIAGDRARILGTAKKGNWTDEELAERAIELKMVNDNGEPIFTRESLADAHCTELQTQQWKDLVDGTIGSVGERGPRLSGIDAIIRNVTREMYHSACVAFNEKLTKAGKAKLAIPEGDELKAAHTAFYTAKKAEIDAEAERRMAKNTDMELSDEDAAMLGLVAK